MESKPYKTMVKYRLVLITILLARAGFIVFQNLGDTNIIIREVLIVLGISLVCTALSWNLYSLKTIKRRNEIE